MDATFFGKRKDKFGVLVAKDTQTAKIVAYTFIQTERCDGYTEMLKSLQVQGFVINTITIDGKSGLFQAFTGIPVQMCHFHQQAIMTRYLTRKPKIPAAIDLRRIVDTISHNQSQATILSHLWLIFSLMFNNTKTNLYKLSHGST